MATNMNSVSVVGNASRDPELQILLVDEVEKCERGSNTSSFASSR